MSESWSPQPGTVEWQGQSGVGMVRVRDTRHIRFYRKSEPNGQAAIAAGGPSHRAVDMIAIQHPGERDRLERVVREDDKFEFPRQWAQFAAQQEQIPDGTPLAVLFPSDPDIVDVLKSIKVFTTEQLASMTEPGLERAGMGVRGWQKKAVEFNESRIAAQPFLKVNAENEALRAELEQLKATVAGLASSGKKDK